MPKRPEDRFGNLASTKVTLSAANTLTFAELQTGISIGTGIGILIDQIDYIPSQSSINEMTASGDSIQMAWCTSNGVTAINDTDDRRVIHSATLARMDFGAAASGQFFTKPFEYQFFPPLIIAAPRLYLACYTSGLASAAVLQSRFNFRYIELTDKEYLELAETFILVG